jgi:hypothetical protein
MGYDIQRRGQYQQPPSFHHVPFFLPRGRGQFPGGGGGGDAASQQNGTGRRPFKGGWVPRGKRRYYAQQSNLPHAQPPIISSFVKLNRNIWLITSFFESLFFFLLRIIPLDDCIRISIDRLYQMLIFVRFLFFYQAVPSDVQPV